MRAMTLLLLRLVAVLPCAYSAASITSLQWIDIPLQCSVGGSPCEDYTQFALRVNQWRASVTATDGLCQEVGMQTLYVTAHVLLPGSGRIATAWMETKGILTAAAFPPDLCSDNKNCNGDRYPSTHPNYLEGVARQTEVLRIFCLTNDVASLLEMAPRYDPSQPTVPAGGFDGTVVSVPILLLVPPGPWKVIPTPTTASAAIPRTPNPDGLPRLALAAALMAHLDVSSASLDLERFGVVLKIVLALGLFFCALA
jgi:hypothetical protein